MRNEKLVTRLAEFLYNQDRDYPSTKPFRDLHATSLVRIKYEQLAYRIVRFVDNARSLEEMNAK